MQSFLKNKRVEPNKKNVLERLKNFSEIYERYDVGSAKTQSDRCVQCGIPYCHNGCPLDNYIPQWLKLVAGNDLKLAFKMSNESSPFPEIMGRVCPQDRLCEGACTLNKDFGAITIGSVETFITEEGFKNSLTLEFPGITSSKKVAVIGAGPAGLSAATFLLRNGIAVDVYEKEAFAGGLLTWGIPSFKLDKSVVFRRVEILKAAGMNLLTNKEVGRDISFDELRSKYDAIFMGIGAKRGNKAGIGGEDASGVYQAMDFLGSAQKKEIELSYIKDIDVKDKKVVVIGGGDTAMDCVRTAIREGAKSALCLYRRGEEGMPGSKKEFKNAKEEGAEFKFFSAPKEIVVEGGSAKAIKVVKTEVQQDGGRGKLVEVAGSEEVVEADIVVLALGFSMDVPAFVPSAGIKTDEWGQILVNKNYETSLEGVYAGGDCYRGANLVVNAALDGREAAKYIADKLNA
ncbi:MAG: glutamate synthase subunit beta [Campylobacterales bacterium]|nr:glutamate synthase subunit beta [Campylobacterales bacterium]